MSEAPGSVSTGLPRYRIGELNAAIGTLLERGFAPRFLLEATVGRPQLKKGHLWLTLTDGESAISAVIWSSQLRRLNFVPEEGDGVVVVGRLNFWAARATLAVQVLDVRPSLSAVLRQFERVKAILEPEGLFEPERKRPLPGFPQRIALVTSVPSSALADMLRTAAERWPNTALVVVPIPVQGAVEARIAEAVQRLGQRSDALGLEALVLARGGGSREDLSVFDSEIVARSLAACPIPVVCGLGHEDDTTIADLVADYRAATPTAALVALLPDRQSAQLALGQSRRHLREVLRLRLQSLQDGLRRQREQIERLHPSLGIAQQRAWLGQQLRLLEALAPHHLLQRGFAVVRKDSGSVLRSVKGLKPGELLRIALADGELSARVESISPIAAGAKGASLP
ncbi:MAG: exodeoxyribonuclease VII large subunit [Cyanobium sp. ELA507]